MARNARLQPAHRPPRGRAGSRAIGRRSPCSQRRQVTRSEDLVAAFLDLACATSHYAGHPLTFLTAVSLVLIWALTGPLFGFSDTWQLVINTSTTIVTFLMVFLIQHTQNRDTLAVQLKLAELIMADRARAGREPQTTSTIKSLEQKKTCMSNIARAPRRRSITSIGGGRGSSAPVEGGNPQRLPVADAFAGLWRARVVRL